MSVRVLTPSLFLLLTLAHGLPLISRKKDSRSSPGGRTKLSRGNVRILVPKSSVFEHSTSFLRLNWAHKLHSARQAILSAAENSEDAEPFGNNRHGELYVLRFSVRNRERERDGSDGVDGPRRRRLSAPGNFLYTLICLAKLKCTT
jgi:hypothetical protein